MTDILTKEEYEQRKRANWLSSQESFLIIDALARYAVAAERVIAGDIDDHGSMDEYIAARKVLRDAGWLT